MEFSLLATVVVAIASLFFVFYQAFVGLNLYGSGYEKEEKAFGLERVVSLPFP